MCSLCRTPDTKQILLDLAKAFEELAVEQEKQADQLLSNWRVGDQSCQDDYRIQYTRARVYRDCAKMLTKKVESL